MDDPRLGYVAVDAATVKLAIARAQGGRNGELRYLGEVNNSRAAVERLVRKLERTDKALQVCEKPAQPDTASTARSALSVTAVTSSRPRSCRRARASGSNKPARRRHTGAMAACRRADHDPGAGRGP